MLFDKTALYEYANKLTTLSGQENWIFKRVLDNDIIKRKIIELNTERQFGDEGVNALGRIIGVYSYATEFMSNGRKRAGEPFNLNDTGAFWASFNVKVFQGHIIIDADGDKGDEDIIQKYGIDILGLTDENLQILIEDAKEFYIDYYRSIL
jgi:hypothetical protein